MSLPAHVAGIAATLILSRASARRVAGWNLARALPPPRPTRPGATRMCFAVCAPQPPISRTHPQRANESGMLTIPAWLRTTIRNRAVELRLCCRITVAGLASYALAEFLHLPLVLWAVLTAIIVTQLSVGRTLKATIDYSVGTLGGAVFSGLVATLIPHTSELGMLAVLAISLAPPPLLAAIRPSLTPAPFPAAAWALW